MRKYVLLGLVIGVLLSMTSVAFAGGYITPQVGDPSPHGNYADTTNKCKVCHAVHNAAGGSAEVLLRSDRNGACLFCHLNNSFTDKKPYGTTSGNYTSESDVNHTDDHAGYTAYKGCVSCHSVHGANTIYSDAHDILKNDPGFNGGGALSVIPTSTPDSTALMEFCRDCHENAGTNDDAGGCYNPGSTGCHTTADTTRTISSLYYTQAVNDVTHVMTTNQNGFYGTKTAWLNSDTCQSCHQAGPNSAGWPAAQANSFPHYTSTAVQFLDYNYQTQDTQMDRVCLNCHTESFGSPYTTGVGKTF